MYRLLDGPFFPDDLINVISKSGRGIESIEVKRPKIIVGMSLTPDFVTKFPPSSLVLPVILDTGCNTGFEIDEKHLVLWSGTDISLYDCIARHDRSDGRRYATRKANIWLHLEAYSGPRFVGPRCHSSS